MLMTNIKKVSSKFYKIHMFNILIVCIFCCYAGHAQNDTIVLNNNDRLIGEIKGIEDGLLILKTEYSKENFKINWADIKSFKSNQDFFIVMADGTRYNATVSTDSSMPERIVLYDNQTKVKSYAWAANVVFMRPQQSSFDNKFEASLALGINLTEGNNFKQLTLKSTLGYRFDKWALSAYGNSVNYRHKEEDLHRTDAGVGAVYRFSGDNFAGVFSDLLSSDVQQLDLRIATRGGVGRYFVNNARAYFNVMGGLAWNTEKLDNMTNENRNSTEAFAGFEVNLFDMKDFSLLTNVVVYPSLTIKDRVRSDVKLDVKYDLPLNLFLKMGLSYNYDRRPVEGASKEDYVLLTTFGWEL